MRYGYNAKLKNSGDFDYGFSSFDEARESFPTGYKGCVFCYDEETTCEKQLSNGVMPSDSEAFDWWNV